MNEIKDVIPCKAFPKFPYDYAVYLASWGKRQTALIFVRFLKCQGVSIANPLWFGTVKAGLLYVRVWNGMYTDKYPTLCTFERARGGDLSPEVVKSWLSKYKKGHISRIWIINQLFNVTPASGKEYDSCLIHNF